MYHSQRQISACVAIPAAIPHARRRPLRRASTIGGRSTTNPPEHHNRAAPCASVDSTYRSPRPGPRPRLQKTPPPGTNQHLCNSTGHTHTVPARRNSNPERASNRSHGYRGMRNVMPRPPGTSGDRNGLMRKTRNFFDKKKPIRGRHAVPCRRRHRHLRRSGTGRACAETAAAAVCSI